MNKEQKDELRGSLTWGVAILVLALVSSFARKQGYVDADTVTRLVIGANGLMIAWFGNRMPKLFVSSACARQMRRVGGWSLTLSGLLYTGLFALAPISVAIWGGTAVVVAGLAVTTGYCIFLRSKAKVA